SSESDSAERPSLILASLHGSTMGEEPTGGYWGGPVYGPGSDSAESYRDQTDYDNRHSEADSAGSYGPYMDYSEGYAEYGEREGSTATDVRSVVSGNDEPPARTIPPKAPPRRSDTRKPACVKLLEVTSSEEETPSTRTYNPTTCVPAPKPHRGKEEVTPVPTPDAGKVTGAPPGMGVRKSLPPKLARGDPPQVGRTPALPMTGGHTGAAAGSAGLFNSPLCSFVPVCVTVSVVVLVPVLLALARVGLLGAPALPFVAGFGAIAR
ncbi:hypothetical protein P4O66_005740, partial [Electrophorus voltai]